MSNRNITGQQCEIGACNELEGSEAEATLPTDEIWALSRPGAHARRTRADRSLRSNRRDCMSRRRPNSRLVDRRVQPLTPC